MRDFLIKSGKKIGIDFDDNTIEKFIKYKEMLIEWNNKINLTAITEEKEIVTKHFIDSVFPVCYRDFKGKKVIDVGTGAGFPSIPIKIICPETDMTLVDSLNKRINFLNNVIEELGLKNIETYHLRAEDGGRNDIFREKYDFCVSRAVAALNILSEYCLPYVRVGGEFIALKGSEAESEIKEAENIIEKLGGKIEDIKYVILPDTDIKHSILFIKKIRECPKKYPRNAKQIKNMKK